MLRNAVRVLRMYARALHSASFPCLSAPLQREMQTSTVHRGNRKGGHLSSATSLHLNTWEIFLAVSASHDSVSCWKPVPMMTAGAPTASQHYQVSCLPGPVLPLVSVWSPARVLSLYCAELDLAPAGQCNQTGR